jgi:hypothetical protein
VILEVKCETQYPSVQATESGAVLKAVPKLSKRLVAYMEGLLAVSLYVNGPFDSRAMGVAEAVSAAALLDLNQLANEPCMAYLKRKLGGWYREPPRPAHKQPAVDADEPRSPHQPPGTRRRQPRPTLPLVEATAVGLNSISKAYRPEFDVWGALSRDRAVPGLHSAVFGSRPQYKGTDYARECACSGQ